MSQDLENLNLVELLALLEPIPEPPPIPLWPLTAGWIWLGLAVLLATAWLIRRWTLRHRANAYRRAALREIAAAGDDPAALAVVIRRTALAGYSRAEVASLYGNDWLAFLDAGYGGTGFSDGPGRLLASAPYRPEEKTAGLGELATEWVRRHRAPEAAR